MNGIPLRFMVSHPSDKNKNVARVGHPVFVAESEQTGTSEFNHHSNQEIIARGRFRLVRSVGTAASRLRV
jgi:hypothetical protein